MTAEARRAASPSALIWIWFECVSQMFMCWNLGPQSGDVERWGLAEGDRSLGTQPSEKINVILKEPWLISKRERVITKRVSLIADLSEVLSSTCCFRVVMKPTNHHHSQTGLPNLGL